MYCSQNQVTLAFCELGSKTMLDEETKLRQNIKHATMPDNNKIMAYPYQYGVDRWISINVTTNDNVVSYAVVFVHRCLLWQHTRAYSLTSDEYETVMFHLFAKYGTPKTSFVSDDNDRSTTFATHCLYWYPESFNL